MPLFHTCEKNVNKSQMNHYRINASERIAGPMLIAAVLCHVVIAPKVYTIRTPKETRTGPQLASQARSSGATV